MREAAQLRSYSKASEHFKEPEGSLPHSQQPSTCPYPESDDITPHYLSKVHPPTYVLISLVVSFLLSSPPITYIRSSCPYSCYIPCPSHSPRLDSSYDLH
jgi:hypothetical protein